MSHIETKLRSRARLDIKWLKVDLQTVFNSQDSLNNLWNSLISDGELTGAFSEGIMNSAGVTARKGDQGKYYCGAKVREYSIKIMEYIERSPTSGVNVCLL